MKAKLRARGINVDGDTANDSGEATTTAAGAGASSTEDPLPEGWAEAIDKTYGTKYYYNAKLGQSSWTRPRASVAPAAVSVTAPSSTLPPGWKEAVDPKTGRTYYCNPFTSSTSWEKPIDAAAVAKMKRCKGCGGFGRGLVKAHGFCLHCSRILNKPVEGLAATTRVPMKSPGAQHVVPEQRASAVVISRGPEKVVAHAVARAGIGPTPHPRVVPVASTSDPEPVTANVRSRPPPMGKPRRAAPAGIDPMDPSSYSDAPVGGWGSGLPQPGQPRAGGDNTALPAPGAVLRQNKKAEEAKKTPFIAGKDGLGENDM